MNRRLTILAIDFQKAGYLLLTRTGAGPLRSCLFASPVIGQCLSMR